MQSPVRWTTSRRWLLVTSLIGGGAQYFVFFARGTWSRQAMVAAVALLAGLFACVWICAWTRPVSFDGARLVDFADWQLFVPGVFEPATIEEAAMRQIHENLNGAGSMPRPQERRWSMRTTGQPFRGAPSPAPWCWLPEPTVCP